MQLRRDPITGSQVLIAGRRTGRPNDFLVTARQRVHAKCPFCRGCEGETPAALASYRNLNERPVDDGDVPDWQVRVVPNKYPAVWDEPASEPARADSRPNDPLGDQAGSHEGPGGSHEAPHSSHEEPSSSHQGPGGRHEVIIEAPRHLTRLTELTDEQLRLTFRAYRDRLRAASSQQGLTYAQVFKNSGSAAGASLEHVHSQLLAMPVVPPRVQDELANCRDHWRQRGECLVCHEIAQRQRDAKQVVAETDELIAWCPPAGRFPYEVWVAPRTHRPRYEEAANGLTDAVAQLVRHIVASLEKCLAEPAYNYYLHTTPFDMPAEDYYHWHWEITPRVSKAAGFEWATGMWINPVVPEDAAHRLRANFRP